MVVIRSSLKQDITGAADLLVVLFCPRFAPQVAQGLRDGIGHVIRTN